MVVEDAWVPPHRFVAMDDLRNGTAPGAEVTPDNNYLRAPMGPTLNTMPLSPMIGIARGVLDLFEERVTKRMDLHTGMPTSETPPDCASRHATDWSSLATPAACSTPTR